MLKFATENATWCGIPNQVMVNLKEGIAKMTEIRTKVCQVAAAPPRPPGPSLNDALSGPCRIQTISRPDAARLTL